MLRTPEPTICAWRAVRTHAPLIHCLTNVVVTHFTANALLAIGAAPAMVDHPDEAAPFVHSASGVLINLGTLTSEQCTAIRRAASTAHTTATPWVLDPVAVGNLPIRTALAGELLTYQPTIIRGNASEIMALNGVAATGRGVDTAHSVTQAEPSAIELAQRTGAVIAVSGPEDLVTDGTTTIHLRNGGPQQSRITGAGCALGAVMAAFASVTPEALTAAVAAITVYNCAAQVAAHHSYGPGTFTTAFLDALHTIDESTVRQLMVIA